MRSCWLLILCLLLLTIPVHAQQAALPPYDYSFSGQPVISHDSPSLRWQIEQLAYQGADCYLTKVWMQDPGRQIGKATADWEENVLDTAVIAQRAPEASLLINASGYVTRIYRWIPDNYPGTNEDYYNTPLGSLTVTNGQLFRCLRGVPYYGLTLNTDGLRLHVGDDPETVLADQPSQTWSFYVECPIIQNHQSILDPEWRFTNTPAMRTIIARMDQNNYLILTVTRGNRGLTMQQCVDFLLEQFNPEWAYNLDGGPSSALMYRDEAGILQAVWENGQENADIMTFSELGE
ncbi:MAG: phosphodiester glycosidase family protein [Clostridiales bacterium]|nr:phosphodiester glycosidase family protein [Clostridiales bacterium]